MAEVIPIELTVMSGPDDGSVLDRVAPKQGDAYIIGRREDCDVILPYDSQVSRQHARLTFKEGQWSVQDMGSRNGTYVGKQKIDSITPLEPGQMFRVGRTWLRLSPDSDKD
ncbi:MAG: FHA domain-containing protein [Chloroflexota bacterium]